MNPGADQLPIEVLEKIFSYLPCEDLVKSVQYVCTWWQQVSWQKSLWKEIVYNPTANKNVIRMLKISPQLRILNLTSATIDNNLINFITDSYPNLECLHISWDSIYNESNVKITRPVSQIKILSLFWRALSCLHFSYLDNAFPNLESLNLGTLKFYRKDLETYLEKKQNTLHTLSIRCHSYYGLCVLPCLSVCTKLRNLSLYKVCDKVLSEKVVGYLPNISHLTLNKSYMSNENDTSAVLCSFPNINSLVLHSCEANENVLCMIAHNCPQLQKLQISDDRAAFSWIELREDILQYALHLERLTHLYIYQNAFVTYEDIEYLQLMPELVHLDVYMCKRVTTGCLKLICGFNKLEVLKFDLLNQPLPADFSASDVKNKNLQLMFYNCRDVSSLDSLRQHLRDLYSEQNDMNSISMLWKEELFDGPWDLVNWTT